jgi:hypothetical protein
MVDRIRSADDPSQVSPSREHETDEVADNEAESGNSAEIEEDHRVTMNQATSATHTAKPIRA